ncbi:hypothetical protein Acr_25g0008510 [Actinidia rufa]|uniref:Uncharacterized protein n=1 Tax=Actinidia rufa TaxID=165716 RepID=A0A7J0H081_9ERIC|nr:hypothetical protein Acr_25g0008510 [Actinidia rufa]
MEVEARESDGVSIVVASSIDRRSSYLKRKDEMSDVNMPEPTFWNKMPETEGCRHTNTLSTFDFEDAPEELKSGSKNESTLSMPSLEDKQIQRKSGKAVRSNSGCSKRSRMARIEGVSINEAEADNVKGTNGLKPDTYDVTAHLDDLSVNELLDGSYKGPSFSKDKGKKTAILNDNILQAVRKACSVLRLHKPLKTKNSAEIDNSCNHKVSTCPVSSNASVAGRNVDDRGDTCTADPVSHDKVRDSFSNPKTPDSVLDLPLCQPKDILERLALPPPKDLDSLLLDVAKPSVLLKNNSDSRGKQISQRATLSPFPWSHNSSGYSKSNPDVIKLSASKTTCQGRWLKIGNTGSSLEGKSDFLVDFESLTYDCSLVPLASLKCGPLENEIAPSTSVSFPSCELGSSLSAALSIASQLPLEAHSPRSLAAAQTLCDIAAHSLNQDLNGMVRWPKKPSEKTMKACKSKSNGKSGELFAAPKSVRLTDDQVKNASKVLPSKKPRLLGGDFGHNTERKGSINWSVPRSNRPSPSKSFRDSFVETKSYNSHVVKQPCTIPPPPPPPPPPTSRVSDKACSSRQKVRKLVPMAWNREGGKLD